MENNSTKNSTIFYHDWMKAFEKMSDEDVGKITKALLNLDIEGAEAEFESGTILDIIYSQFAATVERNKEKYKEISEKRSQARKKPKETNDNNCNQKLSNDNKCDVKDNVKDNVKDKEKISKDKDSLSLREGRESERGERECLSLVVDFFKQEDYKSDAYEFFDYNAGKHGIGVFNDPARWHALARAWEKKKTKLTGLEEWADGQTGDG